MRHAFLSAATVLAFLWIGCDGSGPFDTNEYVLNEPRSHALVDSSVYIDSGGFAPGYLSGNLQSDEMTLRWSCDDSTDFLCYKVFLQAWGQEAQISQINDFEVNELLINNLQQNTNYNMRLERVDRSGMHKAHVLELRTPRWSPPGNVTINVLSPAVAGVTWTDRSDSETSFFVILERRNNVTGEFDPTSSYSVQANETSFELAIPDADYTYRAVVQARSPFETNAEAVSSSFAVQFQPIGSLHAEQATDSRLVELTWVDNSTMETSIEVDRFVGSQPQEIDWIPVAELAANTTSWTDADTLSTAIADTIQYRVRCVNTFQGVRTVTDWRSTNITIETPSMMPQWEYELWDGQSAYRWLTPPDHHVYLFHAADDLDIELCPDSWGMDLVAEIYSANGYFIGRYNLSGLDSCESINDINGYGDYVIDVFNLNGQAGFYQLYAY